MPVSDPMLDPVYAELLGDLRDARTPTPATLTTRVDELLARPWSTPAPRRRRPRVRLPRPGLVLGIAGGCALVALGIFAATKVPSSSTTASSSSNAAAAATSVAAADSGPVAAGTTAAGTVAAPASSKVGSAVAGEIQGATESEHLKSPATGVPTAGDATRLQHQTARLTVALRTSDDVSAATTQVTKAIATYGGHIVTLQFATPQGTDARAEIVAKVPIERMQEATNRFSALGRLAGAQVDISDLQARVDTLEQRVASARLQIARFDAQLAASGLTPLAKVTLVERRALARQRLAGLNANVSQTKQDAALADLTVVLVTDDQVAPPKKSDTGAGARARDALGLLADVAVFAIYALVVLAPLALLAALVFAGRSLLRRRRNRRLLETA